VNYRIVLVVFSYSLLATSLLVVWLTHDPAPTSDLFWQDDARIEVQELIEDHYLEPLTDEVEQHLFDSALRGYVRGLDPFSRYFDAAERRELEEDTRGEFGGVGIQVRLAEKGGVLIAATRVGGPADVAGIEPGSIIEGIEGEPLQGLDLQEMIGHIKGKPGTAVALDIRTPEGESRTVSVERAMVGIDSVTVAHLYAGEPPIGYVRVTGFSEDTGTELGKALDELVADGATAIVLDLRFNVGGVVRGAVDMAALWLPPGTPVCQTRGRLMDQPVVRVYATAEKPERKALDLPLVLLVNDESASASEILAGALQDHGRAVLVGTRTYGKFLMQTLYDLHERDGLVRITTARYETPKGRSAQRSRADGERGGMIPDVRVLLAGETERDRLADEFVRESDLRNWRTMPAAVEYVPTIDSQMKVAFALLRGGEAPAEPIVHARSP